MGNREVKAKWMLKAETLLTLLKPETQGKFQQYGFWDALNYYYACKKTPDTAVANIIEKRFSSQTS